MRLRETLARHSVLAAKLAQLEQRLETHDKTISQIIKAIRTLMLPPEKPRRPIGFLSQTASRHEDAEGRSAVAALQIHHRGYDSVLASNANRHQLVSRKNDPDSLSGRPSPCESP